MCSLERTTQLTTQLTVWFQVLKGTYVSKHQWDIEQSVVGIDSTDLFKPCVDMQTLVKTTKNITKTEHNWLEME